MTTKEEMLHRIADEARGSFDCQLFNPDVDEQSFREYARENDSPKTWEQCEIMHPYCRDEWFKLGKLPEKKQEYEI